MKPTKPNISPRHLRAELRHAKRTPFYRRHSAPTSLILIELTAKAVCRYLSHPHRTTIYQCRLELFAEVARENARQGLSLTAPSYLRLRRLVATARSDVETYCRQHDRERPGRQLHPDELRRLVELHVAAAFFGSRTLPSPDQA